uniref:Hydroxyproline-rich glycoprotein family protein n=1 Tax=Salix viminalis TaxID=40686 RepID=A0A6N2MGT5_SALVM
MEEGDPNRPSLGFPIGLVLLLLMLFIMSGLFSCCLHWEKVLSLFGVSSEDNHSHIEEDIEHLPQKSSPPHVKLKKNQGQSLPVLMPGDRVPKFIAMACPCEPPRTEMIAVQVQKPPPFPAPLY